MKKLSISIKSLIENPFIREQFLSTKKCLSIINKSNKLILSPSLIFSEKSDAILDLKQRKSASSLISDIKLAQGVADKVNYLINHFWKINNLFQIEPGQIAKYQSGDFFNWHQDAPYMTTFDPNSKIDRVFTLIIQLNDHDEFSGGEIEIEDLFGKIHKVNNLKAGEGIIFPSVYPHRVKKIKNDKRYSLTFWLTGKPLVIK